MKNNVLNLIGSLWIRYCFLFILPQFANQSRLNSSEKLRLFVKIRTVYSAATQSILQIEPRRTLKSVVRIVSHYSSAIAVHYFLVVQIKAKGSVIQPVASLIFQTVRFYIAHFYVWTNGKKTNIPYAIAIGWNRRALYKLVCKLRLWDWGQLSSPPLLLVMLIPAKWL
jgi:hypothetical protein